MIPYLPHNVIQLPYQLEREQKCPSEDCKQGLNHLGEHNLLRVLLCVFYCIFCLFSNGCCSMSSSRISSKTSRIAWSTGCEKTVFPKVLALSVKPVLSLISFFVLIFVLIIHPLRVSAVDEVGHIPSKIACNAPFCILALYFMTSFRILSHASSPVSLPYCGLALCVAQ